MVGAPEPGRQERGVLAAARGEAPDAVFFDDELRSPLLVADLARALLELAGRPQITGLLHLGGPESLSRYELARRIAAAHGLAADRIGRARVADSGLVRPLDCTLDSSRARGLLASPIGPVRP
jgi:dTDP-4-dehydrorhamnose reductase